MKKITRVKKEYKFKSRDFKTHKIPLEPKVDLYMKFESLNSKVDLAESYFSTIQNEGNFKEIKKYSYVVMNTEKKERCSYYGPMLYLDYVFVPRIVEEGNV